TPGVSRGADHGGTGTARRTAPRSRGGRGWDNGSGSHPGSIYTQLHVQPLVFMATTRDMNGRVPVVPWSGRAGKLCCARSGPSRRVRRRVRRRLLCRGRDRPRSADVGRAAVERFGEGGDQLGLIALLQLIRQVHAVAALDGAFREVAHEFGVGVALRPEIDRGGAVPGPGQSRHVEVPELAVVGVPGVVEELADPGAAVLLVLGGGADHVE